MIDATTAALLGGVEPLELLGHALRALFPDLARMTAYVRDDLDPAAGYAVVTLTAGPAGETGVGVRLPAVMRRRRPRLPGLLPDSDLEVLMAVRLEPGRTGKRLAAALRCPETYARRRLAGLVRRGWLTSCRSRGYLLTEEGRAALEEADND